MPRARNEKSIEAQKLYSEGKKLVEIAEILGIPEGSIRRWKSTDKWDDNDKNESERSVKGNERSEKQSERSVKNKASVRKKEGQPWERQKSESAQAYEAFVTYRDMGPERSITKVVQELNKTRALIGRWSCTYDWVERVRAYDNELEKEAREKAVKDRKAMIDRHIGIAMQLQKKALEALTSLSVEDMSPKDIKEYIKMATDLERLNRTIEEENGKGNDDPSVSIADTIISAYKRRMEDDNND